MPSSIIAVAVAAYEAYQAYAIVSFAVNMVASAIITKAFFSPSQPGGDIAGASPNPGNRQQVAPATDNKLPVVYGQAWLGGIITDLSISSNNQELYYVLSICEVTNNGADTITMGDVYFGGKKCIFASSSSPNVTGLLDESTGVTDSSVNGKLQIFLYRNGSYNPTNSTQNAIQVMQTSGLIYKWDNSKLMTNCAFAIIHMSYNPDAGLTGIQQTKFQVTNSRYAPGDCILDYLRSSTYGGAIPLAQINTASLTALNTYSAGSFTYTPSGGGTATQARFRFDGIVDTYRSIMDNLQDMASCCDCLIKYNEITGQWGVVVQSPTYTVAMALDDSNITSAIQISPIDIAGSYNVIECKFPDKSNQDAFNSTTFDLAKIDPTLLYPNEPVNKQSISLPLVNNNVRAQYLATRMLKSGREDLQVQVNTTFQGIQLEAGDIVTITNANYGWVAKEFRINKVVEEFGADGTITAKLTLSEFNATVYNDASITEFDPSPNTGIGSPITFGTVPAPVITNELPAADNPGFSVQVTSSSAGIIQYAEVWYSAFSNPTASQRIFAGTTEIQSDGTPYNPNTVLPLVNLVNIPAGNWYFFSRMVNSLATSPFSSASAIFRWRPTTSPYTSTYLCVAYADSITGTNFSLDPRNKAYFGIQQSEITTPSTNPADYTWYLADPAFGTEIYLCYINRGLGRFSFDTGFADYAAGSGAFVPTQAAVFDPSLWSALPDGTNYIDTGVRTGQLIETGTTTVGTGEIAITNNPDGKIVASLKQYLDFGPGVYQKTSAVANLTIDIYGRVVGFETPDAFYMTIASFTATSGQTIFSVTRGTGYITGQCLVFQNGLLLDTSEYTDASASVTLSTGATLNDIITIVSFRSYNSTSGYYASFTRNTATLTNASIYTPGFTLTSGYELLFLNGTIVNELDYDIVTGNITNFPNLATGKLTVIQWTPNNLGTPNGNPVNIVANTVVGQSTYPFNYNTNAFNLYENGVLLEIGTDFTTTTNAYTFSVVPDTITNILVQQTFARTGAA